MTALALQRGLWVPRMPSLWVPKFARRKWWEDLILKLDGQFAPGQLIQMVDGGTQAPPGGDALSFTFVASATSTSSSVTIPGTAAAGDFCIYLQWAANGTYGAIPASTTPSGYSTDRDVGTSAHDGEGYIAPLRAMISRKILVSGDVGSSTTGIGTAAQQSRLVLVFRPSRLIVSVSAVSGDNIGTINSTNPATQTIDVSAEAAPCLLVAQAAGYQIASVTLGGTLASDGTPIAGGRAQQKSAYLIQNATPASKTATCSSTTATRILQSVGYAFT